MSDDESDIKSDPTIARHFYAFRKAAEKFHCEIRLFVPNKKSIRFMGKHLFVPKPIDCKAKTADLSIDATSEKKSDDKKKSGKADKVKDDKTGQGDKKEVQIPDETSRDMAYGIAGLVVDPNLCPEAFTKGDRWQSVLDCWSQFRHFLEMPGTGYRVNQIEGHPRYGCVLHHGKYLYSDYDLYSVVHINPSHRKQELLELTPSIHPRERDGRFLSEQIKRKESGRYQSSQIGKLKPREEKLLAKHESQFQKQTKDFTTRLELDVRDFIRGNLGIDLVQHGASRNLLERGSEKCWVIRPWREPVCVARADVSLD